MVSEISEWVTVLRDERVFFNFLFDFDRDC